MARWDEAGFAIGLLSGKWVISVMRALEEGPLRWGELLRAVSGVGSTPLADTLRRMEQAGLIERSVDGGEMPPAVSYALTEAATDLIGPLEHLAGWWQEHQQDVPAVTSAQAAGRWPAA